MLNRESRMLEFVYKVYLLYTSKNLCVNRPSENFEKSAPVMGCMLEQAAIDVGRFAPGNAITALVRTKPSG